MAQPMLDHLIMLLFFVIYYHVLNTHITHVASLIKPFYIMPIGTNGHCCQWLNVNIHACYEEHVVHFRKLSTLKSGFNNVTSL
jgi:hypothetical protein